MAGLETIAYLESQRALVQQENSLNELRSRTGTLLAAAAITSSFLGAQALRGQPLDEVAGAALVAFVLAVAAALVILWPGRDSWTFVVSAEILLEDWKGKDPARLEAFLAERLEGYWDANSVRLNKLFVWFQVAAVGVAAEVVLWTVQLARG